MSKKRPTYEELLSKLAETEGLLTRLSKKLEAVASQRDTALLGSRELEESFIESEQNFRNSMDACPLGVRIVTEDGELIYANQAILDICGCGSVEELKAVPRKQLYTPESYAAHQERKEKRKRGEHLPPEYEMSIRRPDGAIRNLQVFRKEIVWGGERQFMAMYQDITERKRMEEDLERESQEIRLIIDSSPILIFYKDREGKILRANKAFAEALNRPEEKIVGKTVFDLYSPEIAQGMTNDDREVLKSGRPKLKIIEQYESAIGLRWVQTDKVPIFDVQGIPIGLIGFAQDITERKLAEEALKKSIKLLNDTGEMAEVGGWELDLSTMEVSWTEEVGRIHAVEPGYKPKLEEALDFYAPESRPDVEAVVKRARETGEPYDLESLFIPRGSKDKIWIRSIGKAIYSGGKIVKLAGTFQDITERKQTEERINHLNLTLRSIRNVNQLITREKDRDRLIQGICDALVASRSFYSAWIVLLDESKNPTAWAGANIQRGFPALVESFKRWEYPRCVQKALKQKQTVITEDPPAMCPGCPMLGDIRETGSMTIRLEIQGIVYGVLCTSLPRKLLTAEDEKSLFTEVATDIAFALHDNELESEHQILEQERLRADKLESIGTLAGGIAHDFNNLLTGIMGNIGLVKTHITPSDTTFDMLDEAEKAAVRARDLTRQLLTYARGGKPVKKLVNTADLIKESAAFALRGSNVRLELSLPDDLWSVEADEGQISQVINNLVINADEAMPSGGILKIEASNCALKRVSALPLPSGSYVRIDIKDTGMGISQEHLQRIFEPYFTTKQKGSGLGLSTAYSIIKNHGGYIIGESKQNEGSTFHIYLPASKKTVKGEKQMAAAKSGQAGGKVLVMDDEEVIRKMLKNMLSLAGYEVELTADGAAALEKYAQAIKAGKPFFAVIMDLTIPGGMGGKEAIKKLLEIDPQATAIVSSGYATDPIMSEYKKYGFKAVIAKPYSIKQLRETLSGLSRRKKKQAN